MPPKNSAEPPAEPFKPKSPAIIATTVPVSPNAPSVANVHAAHERSKNDPEVLRLSIEAKAKVKLGEFSRGGRLRCDKPVKAIDHEMKPEGTRVPFGILEVLQKQFNVV